MSDRLQFFREQMAAFEGTSDPQKAIEKGFFIKQPRQSLANTIANRIALRPASSHLLIGGIGSGKTTQLMMARDRINEIDDLHAVYVDASSYTDISEIKPGALLAIVGLVLSSLDEGNYQTSHCRDYIDKEANGYQETKEIKKTVKKVDPLERFSPSILQKNTTETEYETVVKEHKGILNSNYEKHNNYVKKKKLVGYIEKLRKSVQSRTGKIIIIIDGLDRLISHRTFSNIVHNDITLLAEAHIGIILVGSITIAYSSDRENIEQLFNYYYHQPCFDVDQDTESYQFFKKILEARSKREFIQKMALESLIEYSGGVLRDLINLAQAAIEEAYMSDGDNVEFIHVEFAVDLFGRRKILGTSNNELKILKKVCDQNNFIPQSQEDIQLLASQRILEYQYPKRRYAVHPTIKELLQKASV